MAGDLIFTFLFGFNGNMTDLAPLSYIAGTLAGNPRIRVFDGPAHSGASGDSNSLTPSSRTIVPCTQAYTNHGLQHISFEGKEFLGMLNGTSFSAAVASLALGDALQMGMMAMVCTAMGTEALLGTQGLYVYGNPTRNIDLFYDSFSCQVHS